MGAALPVLKCLLLIALLPGLLNGCSDYSRSLPHGYTLEKTNNSTIFILGPEEDFPREVVVPARVSALAVDGAWVAGWVEEEPEATLDVESAPGYFLLNTESGDVALGLSHEAWSARLTKLGLPTPRLRYTDGWGYLSGEEVR
jgi:hypothetical protein